MHVHHESLSDQVAAELRRMIFRGELKPGERINQAALAEQASISRGPVREALRLLQNEGLVKYEVNKGTYVTTLSKQDRYEIYTLRALLEGEAAVMAAQRLTPGQFQQLEALLELFAAGDLEQQAQTDIQFHRLIIDASGHTRLAQMHRQLDTQVGAMFVTVANYVPVRVQQIVHNHGVLLEALRGGEAVDIHRVFRTHYEQALADLHGATGKE